MKDWMRTLVAGLLAAVLLAGAGCNTLRLGYDNADWLAARATAPWLCPTGTQEEALRAVVRDFIGWHRRAELPRYARAFRGLADDVARAPLAPARIEAFLDEVDAARDRSARRLARPVAGFGLLLGPDQRRCLALKSESLHRESVDKLDGPVDEVRARRMAELLEWIEPWLGPLAADQRALLARLLPPPEDLRAVLDARQAKTRRLLAVLDGGNAKQKRAVLRAVVTHPRALFEDEEEALLERWDRQSRRATVAVLGSLTPAQRGHLAAVLRGYAADFTALAGGG